MKLKWNVGLQQTGAAATFCRSIRDDSTAASMGRHHICTARYVLQRRKRKKKRKCQFSRTLLGNKSYVDSPVQPSILLTSWPTFHARHCYTNPCLFLPPLPYAALCAVKGVYQGGIFRFKIHIPEDHPSNLAPTVYFDSVVFHPQIDALTGEVNIKKYFPTWYPDKSRLW